LRQPGDGENLIVISGIVKNKYFNSKMKFKKGRRNSSRVKEDFRLHPTNIIRLQERLNNILNKKKGKELMRFRRLTVRI